jgi:hypothetical protein
VERQVNAPLAHSVEVGCPLAHAFAVFTRRIDDWWPPGHRRSPTGRLQLEEGVGGRLVEGGDDGAEVELGRVVRWDPPEGSKAGLAYTWRPGAPRDRTTLVEVTFTQVAGVTRVDVVHSEGDSGLGAEWPSRAARFDANWAEVLPAYVGAAAR